MNEFKKIRIIVLFVLTGLALGLIITYMLKDKDDDFHASVIDLDEIFHRDTLIVATNSGYIDYYIFKGKPSGFQYEMLSRLTNDFKLNLRIIVENNVANAEELLINRKIDLIAIPLTITTDREMMYSFTKPIVQMKQLLVQRKPNSFRVLTSRQLQDSLISKQTDLGGKTVHVSNNSPYLNRLKNLSNEIADDINVIVVDSLTSEEIIKYLSLGYFDYTVTDENLAKISTLLYDNIDVSLPVSFDQNIAWAVRKESESLLDSINSWISYYKKTVDYQLLKNKYVKRVHLNRYVNNRFFSGKTGAISDYDALIKIYSGIIGWDWRLLASLVFQESRFNPDAVSPAGAFGIMQLMPATAEELGVSEESGIAEQIRAGVQYLKFIDDRFDEKIDNPTTRKKLILVGYNIGFSHVLDAISLAEYFDKDINSWAEIQYFLINLSNPDYYNYDFVKGRGFPGIYGVNYANQVYERYLHYKNIIPE